MKKLLVILVAVCSMTVSTNAQSAYISNVRISGSSSNSTTIEVTVNGQIPNAPGRNEYSYLSVKVCPVTNPFSNILNCEYGNIVFTGAQKSSSASIYFKCNVGSNSLPRCGARDFDVEVTGLREP